MLSKISSGNPVRSPGVNNRRCFLRTSIRPPEHQTTPSCLSPPHVAGTVNPRCSRTCKSGPQPSLQWRARRVQKLERSRKLESWSRSRNPRRLTDAAPDPREAIAKQNSASWQSGPARWCTPEILRGFAMIIVEQAAQPPATADAAMTTSDAIVRFDQPVTEALMVELFMIMKNELGDGAAQRLLTEEDHPIQALDRQNEPFHVSVQIRRTVGQPNHVSSGRARSTHGTPR